MINCSESYKELYTDITVSFATDKVEVLANFYSDTIDLILTIKGEKINLEINPILLYKESEIALSLIQGFNDSLNSKEVKISDDFDAWFNKLIIKNEASMIFERKEFELTEKDEMKEINSFQFPSLKDAEIFYSVMKKELENLDGKDYFEYC